MPDSTTHAARSSAAKTALWTVLTLAIVLAAFAGARSLLRSSGNEAAGAGPAAIASSGPGSAKTEASTAASSASSTVSPGVRRTPAREIPVGEPLPDFTMVDRSGRSVSSADLRGKVWIANFVFTRCATVCPTLTREMAVARTRLAERGAKEDVMSVSFTVDPTYDTPAVLEEYAQKFHADPSTWLFLSADPATVVRVVREGFHLMISDPGDGPPMHSNRFVLVDAEGRTRSSHLVTEEGAVDAIVADALALVEESRAPRTARHLQGR